jgi:hypothetical protein
MNLSDNTEIKFKALEKSHYCPPYKEDNFIETIELESFNGDEAKDKVRDSVQLISHNNPYRKYIIEILDVLNSNKDDFLTDMHKYVSFYWSGVPVLLINIKDGIIKDKQLHISLQKYKSEKRELISDKKQARMIMAGLGTTILLGGFIIGMNVFKRSVSD